jgi:hypothetical protein
MSFINAMASTSCKRQPNRSTEGGVIKHRAVLALPSFFIIMNFELDESLAWDITIRKEWNSYLNKDTVTDEDLIELLKGKGHCSSLTNDDGPEFKALRNQLEAEGYITCQRGWWNGDRVLKLFFLNGVRFDRDDQFSSGAAMKIHLHVARKYALHNNQT